MKIPLAEKFIEIVTQFTPFHDGIDLLWIFFVKIKRKWKQIVVRQYNNVYYVDTTDDISFSYPSETWDKELDGEIQAWCEQLSSYKKALDKDPIEAQGVLIQALPIELRTGLITRRNLKRLMPDWADIKLGVSKKDEKILMDILRSYERPSIPQLTTEMYFEYCKVAYLANAKQLHIDKGLSGREYYKRLADGRDGGLLKVNPKSPQALRDWYNSGERQGCHPWEIYRGGNSTHIDLAITSYGSDDFQIELNAFSTTRLVETCRIAIALKKAGLPFVLANRDSYLLRILEEDWIGILPSHAGIKYGYQQFPDTYNVADCIHLDWLFEDSPRKKATSLKRKIKKLVFWLPERVSGS